MCATLRPDFVDALTETGFENAGVSLYWNPEFGFLGGYQYIITTWKPHLELRSS